MPNTVLVDAGPLIALFDKSDKYHILVKDFISKTPYKFISTEAVITEVSYMLNFSVEAQIDFFKWVIDRGVILCGISQNDLGSVIDYMRKYADLPMDFADASLIIAAQKLGLQTIISLDSDFNVYRLPSKFKIKNIF
ncbi:MAG: PIN domain-containing protein, partial [Elusimicrobiota bacterium]|nr:PIN domain-containing protein [Elusimicrobiota bacterium]